MFTLSELAPLNQHQNTCKLLKPWWEVFMDYLGVLMLMTSVLACTEQLSRDRVLCIPSVPTFRSNTSDHSPPTRRVTLSLNTPQHNPPNVGPNLHSTAQGRRTHLVHQQYVYVGQVMLFWLLLFKIQQIRSTGKKFSKILQTPLSPSSFICQQMMQMKNVQYLLGFSNLQWTNLAHSDCL